MDDQQIIDLYFHRSEEAIRETASKYGEFCFRIAHKILVDYEDSEESVNDTYLAAWNAIPPHRPPVFPAFLGRIVRQIAISRWRKKAAEKRRGGEFALCLEELDDCISSKTDLEQSQIRKETTAALNEFLTKLPNLERAVFLRRYWHMDNVQEIAKAYGLSRTNVTTMLHRTRKKLREHLAKEGLI